MAGYQTDIGTALHPRETLTITVLNMEDNLE